MQVRILQESYIMHDVWLRNRSDASGLAENGLTARHPLEHGAVS